ncbi:hypothetical protein F4859DRAFT_132984 [Xylaria cf. heliscus]|nr:hypothetical protein F4859DRAFT_132984 [Xylaria cf. heliscus]
MFIPEFMTAGYLLAISATPWETPQTHIRHAGAYECPRHPLITATPTPPPTQPSTDPSSPSPLPGSCYTTWDDWEHTTATVKTHSCYTRTSLIPPASCPTLSCAPKPPDRVCVLYIAVSSITVPCATDCCPTTSTVYIESTPTPASTSTGTGTGNSNGARDGDSDGGGDSGGVACPTCEECPIPTEWITYTTGCLGTPTITEVNVVTPP